MKHLDHIKQVVKLKNGDDDDEKVHFKEAEKAAAASTEV